ncbi:unnamed protein product [Albugo candida]|uniref:Uncharacterized protein n=1 Tax=Albugo candida TaxID=65357 RepID=A0A024FX25_9STRA|nr:unnamed protein product [Albugo candida]|eukprot:CCI11214.1 unnamed protein product [Albugo candida]
MPRASKQERHMEAMRATIETKKAVNTSSSGIANSIAIGVDLKVALENFVEEQTDTIIVRIVSACKQPSRTRDITECALFHFLGNVEFSTLTSVQMRLSISFSSQKKRTSDVVQFRITKARLHSKDTTKGLLGLCENWMQIDDSKTPSESAKKDEIEDRIIGNQKNDWTGVTIIAIEGRVRIEFLGMIRHDMMARVAVQ